MTDFNLPSQYMPNIRSPGPGSVDASQTPPFTGRIPNPNNRNFGSGFGGIVNFSDITKELINGLRVPGNYEAGRSYDGSDGTGS